MRWQLLARWVSAVLYNPKKRNIWLMGVLIVIALILVMVIRMSRPEPPSPGALRVVMCMECKKQYVTRVTDITEGGYVCKFCGGKLGYAQKCHECDFEFTNLPVDLSTEERISTMERFRREEAAHQCSNCGSTECGYISVNDFEKRSN